MMLLKINPEALPEAIASIGAHPASWNIFARKSRLIPFKLVAVRTPAANILKQEMLAAGGDAVVPAGCITNAEKFSDVLLLGTLKQYELLLKKLALMPYFGLAAIAQELQSAIAAEAKRRVLQTELADGRIITYEKMRVMGILNITPDSFYAASRASCMEEVLRRAEKMLADGADVLDIGGESTRPGSESVDPREELRRVLPAIRELRKNFPAAVLSIDTYRAATAAAALAAGADIINDISAMEADAAMPDLVVQSKAPIILMHMRGTPKNMQDNCLYANVVQEVAAHLAQRAQILRERGVSAEKIILDPGIGFAKNAEQNLRLLRDLSALTSFGYPVLLAASRKSVIGAALGNLASEERLEGTLATSLQAVYAGASMVRVHDVRENVRAIRMLEAILRCGNS